jgi:penicillin-binding protein 2
MWRPWYALRPSRGSGNRINQPKSVGLRDLVASPEEVGARPELRWRMVGACFVVLLVIVLVRLVLLQVVNHAAAVETVQQNSLRTSIVPASRGQIRDRNGAILVGNKTSIQLQISLQEASNNPSIKGALAALTGLSVSQINARLANVNYLSYQPEPILTSAPSSVVDFVRQHPSEFPGVSLQSVASRYYPLGGVLAPHVLGYITPITQNEINAHPTINYQNNSFYGQSGIENFYESLLRGRDGEQRVRVDRLGNALGTSSVVQPQVGSSVVLNIDAGLQKALNTALAAGVQRVRTHVDPRSGRFPPAPNAAAAVMDVRTGAIVALSSYPSYDLNAFTGGLSTKEFKSLERNGAFNNYVTQGQYTPGSTFKMITATAELQKGVLSAGTYVDDTGTFKVPGCLQGNHGCLFHDDEKSGSGLVNLPLALTKSSDYYFYNLGYLFWAHTQRYGTTAIQDVAAKYGLGMYSLIDLPYESVGRVDSPTVRLALHAAAPKAFPNYQWYTGDNVEMAFGQGSTAVTPISMLDAYATFANGGTRYAPQIAAGIVNPNGRVALRYGSRVLGHVSLPPAVRDPILQGLIGVVNSTSGTAYYPFHQYAKFNLSSYLIAGKTGTASNSRGQEPNSWFVGFGPANSPRYAVICVIGQGGYGADGAAPVVAQAFNYLVQHPLKAVSFAAVHTTTSSLGTTKH